RHDFALHCHRYTRHSERESTACGRRLTRLAIEEAAQDRRSLRYLGMDPETGAKPDHRSEPRPRASYGRIAVFETAPDIRDTRAPINRDDVERPACALFRLTQQNLSAARMFEKICTGLRYDHGDFGGFGLAEPHPARFFHRRPPRRRNLALIVNKKTPACPHKSFHRVTVTLAPWPGFDPISNSLIKRFEPPNPNPSPPPVVYPSFMASSISAIPGP